MSIADKTIHQLVRNRLHSIADLVQDISATPGQFAALELNPDGFSLSVVKAGTAYIFTAPLPNKSVGAGEALEEIESVLTKAKRFAGGAQ